MTGVGLSIAEISTIINNLFVNTLFGIPELVGLLTVIVVFFWIIKFGGSNNSSVLLIGLSTLIIWLGGTTLYVLTGGMNWENGYLPAWVSGAVIVILLTVFAVGFYKFVNEGI